MDDQKTQLDKVIDGIKESARKLAARVDTISQSLAAKNDQTTAIDLGPEISDLASIQTGLDGLAQASAPASGTTTATSTDPGLTDPGSVDPSTTASTDATTTTATGA